MRRGVVIDHKIVILPEGKLQRGLRSFAVLIILPNIERVLGVGFVGFE